MTGECGHECDASHRGDGLGAADDGLGGGPGGAHGAVGGDVDALARAELDQLVVAPEGVHLHLKRVLGILHFFPIWPGGQAALSSEGMGTVRVHLCPYEL